MQDNMRLTLGQFQILLNQTPDPTTYTDEEASLVRVLHGGRVSGHLWRVKMTETDIGTALGLFLKCQADVGTSVAQKALGAFMRDSETARRIYDERHRPTDVPRETKED